MWFSWSFRLDSGAARDDLNLMHRNAMTMPKMSFTTRDWITVGIVSVAAFAYFTLGGFLLATLGDERQTDLMQLLVRFITCGILASVMLVLDRRRNGGRWEAVMEGTQTAVLVIVVTNLTSWNDSEAMLAIRTALMLVGLPALSLLTFLTRRAMDFHASPGMGA